MLWIEASIAFAAVMMVLSTLVTVLIETAHRVFRVREGGLLSLLQHMHNDVLCAQFGPCDQYDVKQFQTELSENVFLKQHKLSLWQRCVKGIINSDHLTSLDNREFIERLARTPFAEKIETTSQNKADTLNMMLGHIVRQYDLFGESASLYFKRRAGLFSILLSLILVLSFNINCVDMFYGFVEVSAALNNFNLANQPELFPVGWQHAPWNSASWQATEGMINLLLQNSSQLVFWLGTLLITAMMIGLGGPFWFDMYRKLGMYVELNKRKAPHFYKEKDTAPDWAFIFQQARQAQKLQQD